MAAIFLFGCSGSGGSGDAQPSPPTPLPPEPPTFALLFPAPTSATDAAQITIAGVSQANSLSAVTIRNGASDTIATLDADGSWRAADVPLQPGSNAIVAVLTETGGNITERTVATVQSRPVLSVPSALAVDANDKRVFIVDAKQILVFDPASGALDVLSSPRIGIGPNFTFARSVTLAADGAPLIADFRRVLRVDPVTGERSEHVTFPDDALIFSITRDALSNRLFALGFANDLHIADLFAMPPIAAMRVKPLPPVGVFSAALPADMAYVAGTDTIYTRSPQLRGLTAIDAATGDARTVSLSGSVAPTPVVGLEYDEQANRVLILSVSGDVLSLDPVSEESSVLLSAQPAVGPQSLSGLAADEGMLWSVSQVAGDLVSIDLASGARTVEAATGIGDGEPSGIMLAGRYDNAGQRFIGVADFRLVAFDPNTGSRELIANLFDPLAVLGAAPSAPSFSLVSALALSRDGARAWLTEAFPARLIEVDLATGEQMDVTSQDVGNGPLPTQIAGLAIDSTETFAYVADRFDRRVLRVDLVTGQRELLPEVTASPEQNEFRALAFDAASNRLLVYVAPSRPTATTGPGIFAVDLATFGLSQLADLSGVLQPFDSVSLPGLPTLQMSLSADGQSLFLPLAGNPENPYARIDLNSGDVGLLGDARSGPPYFLPNAIDAAADGRIFALDGSSAVYVVDAQTGERAIVSK